VRIWQRKGELVRAALESIAYQITDIIRAMERDSKRDISLLRVDGGATGNRYHMQFQSDIAGCEVSVSETEELSGTGAAFMAGMKRGLWDKEIFDTIKWRHVLPEMAEDVRRQKYQGYQKAVDRIRN
jgi:glycerol kinase